jgi:hypothetical protein
MGLSLEKDTVALRSLREAHTDVQRRFLLSEILDTENRNSFRIWCKAPAARSVRFAAIATCHKAGQ